MKEIHDKKPRSTNKRRMRAKLIFNPSAGAARGSPVEIVDVIHEMQAWKLVPEAFLVEPGCDLPGVVQNALAQGIRMFVVCGGDGTISAVAGALAGTRATLGIIPIGTQNNTALSLGIPADIPAAIAILRTGRRIKVDVGMAACGKDSTALSWKFARWGWFRLFSRRPTISSTATWRGSAISWQRWSLPHQPRCTWCWTTSRRSTLRVTWCWSPTCPISASIIQVGAAAAFNDGLLDVLFFADLSKLDLLGYVVQKVVGGGKPEDPRIQHFHVRRVDIDTQPAMPVMADGTALGEGLVRIEVRRRVLAVMVGEEPTGRSKQRK